VRIFCTKRVDGSVKQDFKVSKEDFGRAYELGDQPGCDEYAMLNEKGY
jgi:hypothetical protein